MIIEVLQTGEVNRFKFAYLNTEKTFGFLLEIGMTVKRRRKKKEYFLFILFIIIFFFIQ